MSGGWRPWLTGAVYLGLSPLLMAVTCGPDGDQAKQLLSQFKQGCAPLSLDSTQQALENLRKVQESLVALKSGSSDPSKCQQDMAQLSGQFQTLQATYGNQYSIVQLQNNISILNERIPTEAAASVNTTNPTAAAQASTELENDISALSMLQSQLTAAQLNPDTSQPQAAALRDSLSYLQGVTHMVLQGNCNGNPDAQAQVLGGLMSAAGQFSPAAEAGGAALALAAEIAGGLVSAMGNSKIDHSLGNIGKDTAALALPCALEQISDSLCKSKREKIKSDEEQGAQSCPVVLGKAPYQNSVSDVARQWRSIQAVLGGSPSAAGAARPPTNAAELKSDLTAMRDFMASISPPPPSASSASSASGAPASMSPQYVEQLLSHVKMLDAHHQLSVEDKKNLDDVSNHFNLSCGVVGGAKAELDEAIDALDHPAADGVEARTEAVDKVVAQLTKSRMAGYIQQCVKDLFTLESIAHADMERQLVANKVGMGFSASIGAPQPSEEVVKQELAQLHRQFENDFEELQNQSLRIIQNDTAGAVTTFQTADLQRALGYAFTRNEQALEGLTTVAGKLDVKGILDHLDDLSSPKKSSQLSPELHRAWQEEKEDLCVDFLALAYDGNPSLRAQVLAHCGNVLVPPRNPGRGNKTVAQLIGLNLDDRACLLHDIKVASGTRQIVTHLSSQGASLPGGAAAGGMGAPAPGPQGGGVMPKAQGAPGGAPAAMGAGGGSVGGAGAPVLGGGALAPGGSAVGAGSASGQLTPATR